MHASVATEHVTAEQLASELLTLWQHLMKEGGPEIYSVLEELDLSLTQVKALHVLEREEQTVKAIAERLGMSLPGTSRAVDGLVGRGLLDRREDHDDRRCKRVGSTAAGRDALRRVEAARLSGLAAFTQTLPAAQRRRLSGALGPVLDALGPA